MPKTFDYAGETLTITWNKARCIHAAECVRRLPQVFDPQKRPWVDPAQAGVDEVVGAVEGCPTGALSYERHDGGPTEAAPANNQISVTADGPLYAKGDLKISSPDGTFQAVETRAALCRCGDSQNKPYCDNRHLEKGFQAAADLGEGGLKTVGSDDDAGLRIVVAPNGPLIVSGPLRLTGCDDEGRAGNKAALCRCGASQNKPYCDGSHVAVGFEG